MLTLSEMGVQLLLLVWLLGWLLTCFIAFCLQLRAAVAEQRWPSAFHFATVVLLAFFLWPGYIVLTVFFAIKK